ncbi:cuticle protein 19-like [Macrobrachium nipponense]|uniref:cuticle protein 19-like n=1 Tax=Macrobrachium nipponense TaxID=159736 RepID=UPI0030C87767
MMKVIVAVAMAMLGVSLAFPYQPAPYQQKPLMPYHFQYGVQDPYSGNNFGRHEKSDGNKVYGSYSVDLPDGRKQTVNYKADQYNGFVADVTYSGQPYHPVH